MELTNRAKSLWQHLGRVVFPSADERPLAETVELVTPEGFLLMEEDFEDDADESQNHHSTWEHPKEPCNQVLFSEKWEGNIAALSMLRSREMRMALLN